jgi:predicted transcriptional regulator
MASTVSSQKPSIVITGVSGVISGDQTELAPTLSFATVPAGSVCCARSVEIPEITSKNTIEPNQRNRIQFNPQEE